MKADFDEKAVREALANIIEPGNVFEIRIISNSKQKPISGYFKDADSLLEAFNAVDFRNVNVYVTLQQVNNDCASRTQANKFVMGAQATSDNDIVAYRWLFIDLDPERTSGVSSSESELSEARSMANDVYRYMKELGFYEPLKAYSGNGCHLLYKICLSPTEENKQLLQNCLEALSSIFDNGKVKIDIVNFNPARICKLYGTVAKKGSNTAERPWRLSSIINTSGEFEVTPKVFLEKLAAQLPKTEVIKPAQYNNYSPSEFDVEAFMNAHGIQYTTQAYKGGAKYVLAQCPFDESHKAPDSAIFKLGNGALGFKCLHNSCADKTWHDFRVKFEPDAYERKVDDFDQRFAEGIKLHNRMRNDISYQVRTEEQASIYPMFLNMEMVNDMPDPFSEYIKTGITDIDEKMQGLAKKAISVVTGCRGAAKSTFLSQVTLNAIERGCNVVVYSGELSPQNFWRWLSTQAAGKNNVIGTGPMKETWRVKDSAVLKSIAQWMGSHLWLYNNEYGNNFKLIAEKIRAAVADKNADLLIIDNLMALDLTDDDRNIDKYEAQTKFVLELKKIAITCNVHVAFVAHPRKAQGFLRLDDISGTGNIANIVDSAFIVHRINEDFKRLSKQMFKWPADHKLYNATNCIEICKDREGGIQDYFIPLYYEGRTKRLLNTPAEYTVYSWEQVAEPDEEPY